MNVLGIVLSVIAGLYVTGALLNRRLDREIQELEDRLRILDAACKLTDEEWEERMSDA